MTSHVVALPDLDPLLDYVRDRTGLSLGGHRVDDLRTAFHRALADADVCDVGSLVGRFEAQPSTFDRLVERLTVGETHFFREPRQLELLTGRILPALRGTRPSDHRLRLWSAGCAAGEEAYTLAILAEEAGVAHATDILGTDICAAAIDRARRATYRSWSLRGVDEGRLGKYFRADGERFRLKGRIADQVAFRQLNLVADPYPSADQSFDVIFCRNVLIYLTPQAIERVVRRLVAGLAPEGWLVTASSDPNLGDIKGLETVVTQQGFAYRRLHPKAVTVLDHTTGRTSPSRHEAALSRRQDASVQPAPRTRVRGGFRPLRAATSRRAAPDEPRTRDPKSAVERSEQAARIRSLADAGELDAALAAAESAVKRSPTDPQIHHLKAVLLLDCEHWDEASSAATAALYLDPNLAATEILRGRARLALDDRVGASRAFRNARRLLEQRPGDETVRFTDATSVGRLLTELSLLGGDGWVAQARSAEGTS